MDARAYRGKTIRVGAETYNGFVDASRANKEKQAGKRLTPVPKQPPYQLKPIRVTNDTGDWLGEYSIVGIDTPQELEADDAGAMESLVVRGVLPDLTQHRGRFAITLKNADPDEAVPALLSGVALLTVDAGGVDEGDRAEVVTGNVGKLAIVSNGSAEILWRAGGTGEQLALIRLGPTPASFPVVMEFKSGTQGTATTPAIWVYDVKDLQGRVLATNVNPALPPHRHNRPGWGAINQAQYGFATYSGGELVILQCNEVWEPTIHGHARQTSGALLNPEA